jgi:hypothetical protein
MLVSALVSLLIGIVLGRRFRVLVLVPAFILTLVLAVATGFVRTDAAWSNGLTTLVVISGLQVGYLLGSGLRHVMVLVRANRLRSATLTNTLQPHPPAH